MANPIILKTLRALTGCSLVECHEALKICKDNEHLAYEYLRLKSTAVKRMKLVKGKWVNWTEADYVKEAERQCSINMPK